MQRNITMEEISDGRLYELNDMVKANCNDCKGCSSCCGGMGSSIILDPLDIYQLTTNLNNTFEELLTNKIELNVVDGIILPNLKMADPTERCAFLNDEGRCSIHSFRPGICRLFPLGRFYENNSFKYFLQTHECKLENRSKIKVRKWIDIPDIKDNEQFIIDWHYFQKDIQGIINQTQNDTLIKKINMYILSQFFATEYDKNTSFYIQFNERLREAKQSIMGK